MSRMVILIHDSFDNTSFKLDNVVEVVERLTYYEIFYYLRISPKLFMIKRDKMRYSIEYVRE